MKKLIYTFCAVLILQGCVAPTFKIVSLNDKFSDPKLPYGFLGTDNKLSNKSSKDGIHIDSKGVYLNPFVYKDRNTNKISRVGFSVSHYNFDYTDGFRPIKEAVFLTNNGERIVVKFEDQGSDFNTQGWNIITKDFNTSFSEKAIGFISIEDFIKLAKASSVEVKIAGGKLSQTYNKKDVLESFLRNLQLFYSQQFIDG